MSLVRANEASSLRRVNEVLVSVLLRPNRRERLVA